MSKNSYVYENVAVKINSNDDFMSTDDNHYPTNKKFKGKNRLYTIKRVPRNRKAIENSKRNSKLELAVRKITRFLVLAVAIAMQVATLSYIMMYLGFKEHPAYTQAAIESRIITSLMQGSQLAILIDFFMYELYGYVMKVRRNRNKNMNNSHMKRHNRKTAHNYR